MRDPFPHTPRFMLRRPTNREIADFRVQNLSTPFGYAALGESASGHPPGYQVDHNRVLLGHGEDVWLVACAALREWKMFPSSWATIAPTNEPIVPGLTLTMIARAYGVWWMNACRIVYLVDNTGPTRRFGFAYGTLNAHVEEGEERFLIEMLIDGSVWYDLRAFSRPRFWPVRFAKPLTRRLQRRFVQQSLHRMRVACGCTQSSHP